MSLETRILRSIDDGHGRATKEQLREYRSYFDRRHDEDRCNFNQVLQESSHNQIMHWTKSTQPETNVSSCDLCVHPSCLSVVPYV